MTVKAICRYYCRATVHGLNPKLQYFFNYLNKLPFIDFSVIPSFKVQLLFVVILTRKATTYQARNGYFRLYA
jgi:hypothetical protein